MTERVINTLPGKKAERVLTYSLSILTGLLLSSQTIFPLLFKPLFTLLSEYYEIRSER